jgi:hypothetical protein
VPKYSSFATRTDRAPANILRRGPTRRERSSKLQLDLQLQPESAHPAALTSIRTQQRLTETVVFTCAMIRQRVTDAT